MIGREPTSISKGVLKNDVMSVTVRPWPIREWRERLLVKLCGGEDKRFVKLISGFPLISEKKNSHCALMVYLRF